MRHLDRILEVVYLRPWAITPSRFQAIHVALQAALENKSFFDLPSDDSEDALYTVVGKTAIVPVCGTILNKASGLEAACGAFSLQTFKQTLDEIEGLADVANVVLSIDSGGGTCQGLPEAAAEIRDLAKVKNVIAYTDGTAASAAYYLACQAPRVFLSQSAEVGSIGVYCAFLDQSKAFANEGLTVEVFKGNNAPYKAMGYPGLSLSDAQRTELQAGVDKTFADFKATVLANRKGVSEDVFTARMYEGADAVSVGLADGVVNDFDDLIDYLNK